MSGHVYPEQRTSRKEKVKKRFYIDTINYFIDQSSTSLVEQANRRFNIMSEEIDLNDYRKVLNPYNAVDERFTRFPADMRNYDIIKDIVRRFIGEYIKQPFQFQVKANDMDVVSRFNDKLAEEMSKLAVQQYINVLNEMNVNTGVDTKDIPDFEKFYKDFKENYRDEVAADGQSILDAILDWTESHIKYYTAFYYYVVAGVTYSYRDIRNGSLYKEIISPLEYRPITNGEPFVEDHDAGVRKFRISYYQILERFSDILDDKTLNKIKDYIENYTNSSSGIQVPLHIFKSSMDSKTYETFATKHGQFIENDSYNITDSHLMVDAYHIVFKTEVKVANVLMEDPITGNLIEEIYEVDEFELKPELGHISVEWEWIEEIWESYRFGREYDDIFTKPRPIAYQRRDNNNRCKLPYNGISEIIPNSNFTFSIPESILPFQIARNIFAYYREKIIAKNKDKILLIPKSLFGSTSIEKEENIHRIEASSIFTYDDSEDDAGTKAQHIRVVDASLSQFISHITDIMDRMKEEAWDTVDMNRQRYGEMSTSDGKGVTQEAIVRSSMGSVIIYTMFEKWQEKEFEADLDYSKIMAAEGNLQGSYTDSNNTNRFLDIDTDQHIMSLYGVNVESSFIQAEKKRKMDDMAFNASQNGDFTLAIEAIDSNNMASVKKAFKDYETKRQEFERATALEKDQIRLQVEEVKFQNDQASRDQELYIETMKEEGEMSRKLIDAEIKLAELEMKAMGEGEVDDSTMSDIDSLKTDIEERKLALQERKQSEDARLKEKQIDTQYKIAKENKNKYDRKAK